MNDTVNLDQVRRFAEGLRANETAQTASRLFQQPLMPDAAVEASQLAPRVGLPPGAVLADLDRHREDYTRRQTTSTLAQSPALRAWLGADPLNPHYAADDLPTLAEWEAEFRAGRGEMTPEDRAERNAAMWSQVGEVFGPALQAAAPIFTEIGTAQPDEARAQMAQERWDATAAQVSEVARQLGVTAGPEQASAMMVEMLGQFDAALEDGGFSLADREELATLIAQGLDGVVQQQTTGLDVLAEEERLDQVAALESALEAEQDPARREAILAEIEQAQPGWGLSQQFMGILPDVAERLAQTVGEAEPPRYTPSQNVVLELIRGIPDLGITIAEGADLAQAVVRSTVMMEPLEFENYRAAEAYTELLQQGMDMAFPRDAARQGDFATQLAAGGSSLMGFYMLGAARVPVWVAGGLSQSSSGYEDAVSESATAAQRYATIIASMGLGATEALPIDRALNRMAGDVGVSRFTSLLVNSGSSSIEEFLQEFGQAFGEDVIARHLVGYDSDRQMDWAQYAEQGLMGAITGGVAGGVTSAIGMSRPPSVDLDRIGNSGQTAERVGGLFDRANQTQTRDRSPEAFASFLQQAGAEAQEVYVPAEDLRTYQQSSQFALSDLGVTEADLEAAGQGGMVAIPMDRLLSRVTDPGAQQWFTENAVADPLREMSVAERAREGQRLMDEAQAEVERIRTGETTLRASDEQVRDIVLQQLRDAGRAPEVAQSEATFFTAFFRTMAERYGADPLELYQRFYLRFAGPFDREGPMAPTAPVDAQARDAGWVGEDAPVAPRREEVDAAIAQVRQSQPQLGLRRPLFTSLRGMGGIQWRRRNPATGETELSPIAQELAALGLEPLQLSGLIRTTGMGDIDNIVASELADGGTPALPTDDTGTYVDRDALIEAILQEVAGTPFYTTLEAQQALEQIDALERQYQEAIDAAAEAGVGPTSDPRIMYQGEGQDAPRANIQLPSAGVDRGTTVINLFENSDLSSVIHESGHYFYEVFSTLAADPRAPQQMRDDLATLQGWMGTEPSATPSVEAHEKMARGMERYVMEGKAPSLALASVFGRFKSWLTRIYRTVRGLNVNLTPEVREVFDRMIATDQEIVERQADLNMRPMFTGDALGDMDARTQETYQRLARERTEQATGKLLDKAMVAARRRKEAWWKKERETRINDEMERLGQEPAYRAIDALTTGKMAMGDAEIDIGRIDRAALIDMFGQDVLDDLRPAGFGMTRAIYTTKDNPDGMAPQEVAELFGFRDAQQMVDALREAGNRQQIAEARVEQAMVEEYGDPFTDGSIEAEALEAVHSDQQADMVAMELRHVAAKRGQDTRRMQPRIYRARAVEILSRLEVRQVMNPNRFLVAERRAAKEAERQLAGVVRGDPQALAAAQQAKEQQLLNHYLYLEARDLERVISRKREEMRGYEKADTRRRVGSPHIEQIDAVLDNYEFRQRSQPQIDRQLNLRAYIDMLMQEERIGEVNIDERLVENARRTHYSRLTVDELRGVFDTVDNIAHIGRRTREVVTARRKRMLEESAARVAGQIIANQKTRDDAQTGTGRRIINTLSRVDTIAVRMDGGEEFGIFHDEIKREIDEAQAEEQRRSVEAMQQISALFATHYSRAELRDMAKERSIPNAGMWTREQILALALNTGTESNFQRVMDPRVDERVRMSQDRLDALLSTLDERDWRFVQDTWNLIDSYYPDLAAVERRMTGVEPKKIEARPMWEGAPDFVTGGYFRLYYDPTLSARARKDETQQSIFEGMSAGWGAQAQVSNGMTIARQKTAGGRAVLYSFSPMTRQLRETVRRITLAEAVDGTARILNHPDVQAAWQATGNLDVGRTLDLWLKDIASGPIYNSDPVNSAARLLKNNFTLSRLAFNVKTVLLQLTGLTQASVTIGHANMVRGLARYGRNLTTIHQEIIAKSPFMEERMSTFQKDIMDFRNEIAVSNPVQTGTTKALDTIARFGFEPIIRMQFHGVDVPTWLGAYEGALAEGLSEQEAIYRADRMVARSQDSGLMADRAAVERGTMSETSRQSDIIRLFTTLAGYMMTKMNRANVQILMRQMQIRQADSPAVRAGIAMKLAGDLMILYAAEAAIMGLMYAMISDEDEPEDLVAFIARETALTTVAGIPVVRDIAGAAQGFTAGGVYGSATNSFGAVLQQAMQGEADDAALRVTLDIIGLGTGLPSTQTYRIIEQFTGDDDPSLSEALVGSNPLTR